MFNRRIKTGCWDVIGTIRVKHYSFNIPCFQLIPKERPPVKARINYWKPENLWSQHLSTGKPGTAPVNNPNWKATPIHANVHLNKPNDIRSIYAKRSIGYSDAKRLPDICVTNLSPVALDANLRRCQSGPASLSSLAGVRSF